MLYEGALCAKLQILLLFSRIFHKIELHFFFMSVKIIQLESEFP
jgi:hypothetical protein